MDSLFIRDLEPLSEHEFVTQWDCYGSSYLLFSHSSYLCEAFHIMATAPPPHSGSTDWGSLRYFKLWWRLIAGRVPPFQILSFCFNDGRSCRLDNRLPDPFTPDPSDGQCPWEVHLHNQWEKPYPPNSRVERLLLRRKLEKRDKRISIPIYNVGR
ncbi:hypothetical protein BDN72DRAFT_872449 [Pluteus cervinus]|uniref:Uncharacterized protein n=1 Tax=Pluteus cervinus TaxID=181527 RepID=A0ACD3AAZ4_9AGAR|nr:hypothetical protein BDN72DRAFT_872449 [Pluteus cervinus]